MSIKFDMIVIGKMTHHLSDVVNEFGKQTNWDCSTSFKIVTALEQIYQSAVMLFSDLLALQNFNRNVKLTNLFLRHILECVSLGGFESVCMQVRHKCCCLDCNSCFYLEKDEELSFKMVFYVSSSTILTASIFIKRTRVKNLVSASYF
jgi:hypothetical protein